MRDVSRMKFTLCMAACIILALVLAGCGGGGTTVASTAVTTSSLKAGAGSAEITFPSAMFATPSVTEGLNGTVHDAPHARVMVLETNSKVAIVTLELVRTDADGVALVKDIVNKYTGTPKNNIWVHSNHTITTPHELTDATLNALWMTAVGNAVTTASQQAAANFQPAVAGFGTGTSDVTVNRNVLMSDGKYHIGLTGDKYSDKEITILRVNSLSTRVPLGFIVSYGVKPTAVDNAGMAAGVRQISADVPGLASLRMEQQFAAPALFIMAASADQVPKYDAYRAKDAGSGTVTDNNDDYPSMTMDAIFAKMTPLGEQMGADAISIAKNISCTMTNPTISYTTTTFKWPAVSYNGGLNEFQATAGTLLEMPVDAVRFGDSAFIGLKPEIDAATGQELKVAAKALGFSHTMVGSFVGGDAKYMPHSAAYGGTTEYSVPSVEAKKTGFAQGGAEQFVKTSLKLLNGFLGLSPADTTAPAAITTQSAPASGKVTITILAYDDLSGVASIMPASAGTNPTTITQGATATYTVSANGTYTFTVTDNAANSSTISVTVTTL